MAAATYCFDTLHYYHQLKAAGVPEKQATAHAHGMAQLIDEKLATKQDLHKLETRIEVSEAKLEAKINNLEERLTYKLMYSLTMRFGSMIAAAVATLSLVIKFYH